jgi:Uma2 family endonuclease
MIVIATLPLTFESFLTWDDGSDRSFELRNGIAMPISEPNAKHEDVMDGLCQLLSDHCQSLALPYVPRQGKQIRLITAPGENESSRDRMRQSSASAAAYVPPPLVIEVVSTNWRDDYRIKLNEYETLGVLEFWIVDYAVLGGVQYIGSPKQPTVTIHRLMEGEYQGQQFQGDKPIFSSMFSQLVSTTQQIVAMTEV